MSSSFIAQYKPEPRWKNSLETEGRQESLDPSARRRIIQVDYVRKSVNPTFGYTSKHRARRTAKTIEYNTEQYEEETKLLQEKSGEMLNLSKPSQEWRLYVIKGKSIMESIPIHRKSCYMIGRDPSTSDITLIHPGVSSEHALIQFRRESTDKGYAVFPFIMDLGSENKTFLNNIEIDPLTDYELKEHDSLKFGLCDREYILMIAH